MALSMGMAMEFSHALGYCDYADVEYASDLTDSESDEEYAYTPRAFERTLPRSSKRTYGVFVDSAGVVPERRKRSRIDEQLELLRAAIPNLCTNEKESILAGAYEYIENLQRQVQELNDELDGESAYSDDDDDDEEDDVSSCEDDLSAEIERPVDSNAGLELDRAECCGCSNPTVEVVRTEEGSLKIHMECVKRPHVLADIMEMLESSGMNVEEVSIAYDEDSQFVFDCVGSEVDGKSSRHLEACLRSLIGDQRVIASPLGVHVRSLWQDDEVSYPTRPLLVVE